MKKIIAPIVFLLLFALPFVLAAPDFNTPLDPADEQALDQILSPVLRIYNAIKYVATVVGVLMMVFAGISFMMAGGELAKKERAKVMAVGVIIGLVVIWVAPLVVQYFYK
ncbi:MAG TPA: pilin [Candidatus Nanoarchaeia archaeon]|nr:pilin [Candidatus Nanoarchaeia archaeon]